MTSSISPDEGLYTFVLDDAGFQAICIPRDMHGGLINADFLVYTMTRPPQT